MPFDYEVVKKARAIPFNRSTAQRVRSLVDEEAHIAVQRHQVMVKRISFVNTEPSDAFEICVKLFQFFYEAGDGAVRDIHSLHFYDSTDEIHAVRHILNILLVMMQLQVQVLPKKCTSLVAQHQHIVFALADDCEIIDEPLVSRTHTLA